MSISNGNYNFIPNNVKGIKASEKRQKLFEYPRNKINMNGFIFLQETHSSSNDEQKWKTVKRVLYFFYMEKPSGVFVV